MISKPFLLGIFLFFYNISVLSAAVNQYGCEFLNNQYELEEQDPTMNVFGPVVSGFRVDKEKLDEIMTFVQTVHRKLVALPYNDINVFFRFYSKFEEANKEKKISFDDFYKNYKEIFTENDGLSYNLIFKVMEKVVEKFPELANHIYLGGCYDGVPNDFLNKVETATKTNNETDVNQALKDFNVRRTIGVIRFEYLDDTVADAKPRLGYGLLDENTLWNRPALIMDDGEEPGLMAVEAGSKLEYDMFYLEGKPYGNRFIKMYLLDSVLEENEKKDDENSKTENKENSEKGVYYSRDLCYPYQPFCSFLNSLTKRKLTHGTVSLTVRKPGSKAPLLYVNLQEKSLLLLESKENTFKLGLYDELKDEHYLILKRIDEDLNYAEGTTIKAIEILRGIGNNKDFMEGLIAADAKLNLNQKS